MLASHLWLPELHLTAVSSQVLLSIFNEPIKNHIHSNNIKERLVHFDHTGIQDKEVQPISQVHLWGSAETEV